MQNESGILSFTANGAIGARIRVKMTAASTTLPPQVEVAGVGEQHIGVTEEAALDTKTVSVRLRTCPGSVEMVASKDIAIATVVYGAALGKVSDASSGSAIGMTKRAASGVGSLVEILPFNVQSTTAATTSIVDAGTYTAETDVEAALQEIYRHLTTAQGFLPVPLTAFRELSAGVVQNLAAHGGILASDSTPILTCIGDGDALRVAWAAGNTDQIAASLILPPDCDGAKDVVVHFLASKDANVNNACHMDGEAYFGESDVDCFPAAAAANLLVQAKGEYTATILAADVPDTQANANMTLVVMPEAHAADVVYLHACWIEYSKKILTV
jgi:hypothetical protein